MHNICCVFIGEYTLSRLLDFPRLSIVRCQSLISLRDSESSQPFASSTFPSRLRIDVLSCQAVITSLFNRVIAYCFSSFFPSVSAANTHTQTQIQRRTRTCRQTMKLLAVSSVSFLSI